MGKETTMTIANGSQVFVQLPIKSIEFDKGSMLIEFTEMQVPPSIKVNERPIVIERNGQTKKRRTRRVLSGNKISALEARSIKRAWKAKHADLVKDRRVGKWMEMMARRYKCSRSNIAMICYGLTWKHVR